MLNNIKKIITIFTSVAFSSLITIVNIFQFHIIEYTLQRLILANNPTIFFSCDKFQNENYLNKLLVENKNEKIILLNNYLSSNNGSLIINTVGKRCPNKYQFVAVFGGEKQRLEIEKILGDQTIDGVPVFLSNK